MYETTIANAKPEVKPLRTTNDAETLDHGSASPSLPRCFADHGPPQSVCLLFASWVRQADATDSGRIEIRLDAEPSPTGRPYSRSTVNGAIRWLVAHRLLMQTKRGGGGRGSTYFVRWSFTDEALTARRQRVNRKCVHPTQTQTGIESPYTLARDDVEERQERKTSSQSDASRLRSAKAISVTPFSTSKTLRYCIAQTRAEVDALPDVGKAVKKLVIDSTAAILHREHRAGRLRPGRRLGVFIDALGDCVPGLPGEDIWDTVLSVDERLRSGEADVEEVHDLQWRFLAWSYWQVSLAQRFAARVCA